MGAKMVKKSYTLLSKGLCYLLQRGRYHWSILIEIILTAACTLNQLFQRQ